jgi:two-component system cell cycle sensor histidine kinase/response regulator CckA
VIGAAVQEGGEPRGALLARAARWLAAPSPVLRDSEQRRNAQLLAVFLLVMIAVFLTVDTTYLVTVPNYLPPWYGYLFLFTAYGLSRTRHHRVAASLVVAMFPIVGLAHVLTGQAANPVVTLGYLVLSPMVGALFLSVRGVTLLGVANAAGIASLPFVAPHIIRFNQAIGPLSASVIAGVLAVVYMKHRSAIEAARQAERSANEQRLRLALSAARMGMWDWDILADRIVVSRGVEQLLCAAPGCLNGPCEAYLARVHPEDRAQVEAEIQSVLRGNSWTTQTHRIVCEDGCVRWVQLHGQVFRGADRRAERLAGIVVDVTERRELERQLQQAQKLEAIGQLAGGVAHDFNNLLTVIQGNVELMSRVDREELREIAKAVASAAELTQQLLAFSRRALLNPTVVDLDDTVRSASRMIDRIIGDDVATRFVPHGALWKTRVDEGQIQQILLNLAANARDAMPDGGTLTIATNNVRFDDASAPPGVQAGDWVMIEVRDTGHGMDEATRSRIFEPFFTTKEVGGGTGLGLSVVFGIVAQSGGRIDVESSLGAGATFRLYFPRVEDEVRDSQPPRAQPTRGSETILVVEDDARVRSVCERVLTQQGFRVLAAACRADALRVFVAHGDHVDLLLTDVVMPGGSGAQLAAELRAQCPKLKVLFMSAHVPAERLAGLSGGLLRKPFEIVDLTRSIRRALASG